MRSNISSRRSFPAVADQLCVRSLAAFHTNGGRGQRPLIVRQDFLKAGPSELEAMSDYVAPETEVTTTDAERPGVKIGISANNVRGKARPRLQIDKRVRSTGVVVAIS